MVLRDFLRRFRTDTNYDPRKVRIAKLEEEVFILSGKYRGGFGMMLFEDAKDYKSESGKQRNEKIEKKLKEISKLNASLEDDKNNIIYENAFEWRFEFPQVLNNEGDFVGFDVVIGNPPYIKEHINKKAFEGLYNSPFYQGKMDIWTFFGSFAFSLLKEDGLISFIAPNNWITNYGASIFRNIVLGKGMLLKYLDFGNYMVFDEASIQTMIFICQKCTIAVEYKFP